MTKVGEHITLDIIGTTKEYSPEFFEKMVYRIAKLAKVTVLEISKYKFEPQGFTLVALLAESHISFHTFPEFTNVELYKCSSLSATCISLSIKSDLPNCSNSKISTYCPALDLKFSKTLLTTYDLRNPGEL